MNPNESASSLGADVSVLRWPSEERLRQQLAWFGLPRVLLVDPGVRPPRAARRARGLDARSGRPTRTCARGATSCASRAAEPTERQPVLDGDGLLWVGTPLGVRSPRRRRR